MFLSSKYLRDFLLGIELSSQWRSKLGWEKMKGDGCRRGSGLELGGRKEDASLSQVLSREPWTYLEPDNFSWIKFCDSLWVVLFFLLSRCTRVELLSSYLSWMDDLGYFSYELMLVAKSEYPEVFKERFWKTQHTLMKTLRCLLFVHSRAYLTILLDLCQDICCRELVSALDLGLER